MSLKEEQKKRAKYTKGEVAKLVIPSETEIVSDIPFNLYVGTGGHLMVQTLDGERVFLKNIPSGTFVDFIKFNKVLAKGTTATDLVAIH
tara:strand:- start:184 stop:450 length:267 start_codon:yes stop_codon:yes gene_type:complete